MYNTSKKPLKVYLISKNNNQYEYKNIQEAGQLLSELFWCHRFNNHFFGDEFKWIYDDLFQTYYKTPWFVMRTELGDIITYEELKQCFPERKRSPYYYWRYIYDVNSNFRSGPVPHVNTKRTLRIFRNPKTFQEIRFTNALEYDEDLKPYKIKYRKKRKNLPNDNDEVFKSKINDYSWKRFRRHQYKSK